jgi:hypothetical protein
VTRFSLPGGQTLYVNLAEFADTPWKEAAMLVQEQLARTQSKMAMLRYHSRFDNERYRTATDGKSVQYANALIDEALAICGHPWYRLSHRHWAAEAEGFLKRFGQ